MLMGEAGRSAHEIISMFVMFALKIPSPPTLQFSREGTDKFCDNRIILALETTQYVGTYSSSPGATPRGFSSGLLWFVLCSFNLATLS